MIRLFGRTEPTAIEAAEGALSKATGRRDRLRTQLADAQGELAQCKATATRAALDHGADIDEYGADIATQTATCDALTEALDTAQRAVADAEQALAEAVDCEAREQSIAAIEALQSTMKGPAEQLIAAVATLVPLAQRGAAIAVDMRLVAGWLEQISLELPQALQTASVALTGHAQSIRSGAARAHLPQVVAETKPTIAPTPQPVTRSVVTKYDIRWTNAAGAVCYCKQYWDCGLPEQIVERAIAVDVVVDASCDEAKKLRQRRLGTSLYVDFDRCTDVDVDPPKHPDPLPAVWIGPTGIRRYEPPIETSAPLSSWIGGSSRPSTSSSESF